MIPSPSEENCPSDKVEEKVSAEVLLEVDFEQCREGLRCFLKSRLGQDSDVDDCLQNVSLKWIQHGSSIPKSAVRAWLFAVASNESSLVWRKRSRSQQVLQSIAEQTSEHAEPQDSLDQRETQELVQQAVSRLPEDMQAVVRLRLESDTTFEQIAEKLKIPLGTALSRMHRALTRLEKELEPLN
jgi:RNA polymerase sigma factor (sigma-70 family)